MPMRCARFAYIYRANCCMSAILMLNSAASAIEHRKEKNSASRT